MVQRTCARQYVCEEIVKALLIVSPALLRSLAFQVHRQNLVSEHVLGALQRADNRFLKDLCPFDRAFHARAVEPGQILFLPYEDCNQAIFVVRGDLLYIKTEGAMKPTLATRTPSAATIGSSMEGVLHIGSGDWIADVALWCRWHSRNATCCPWPTRIP